MRDALDAREERRRVKIQTQEKAVRAEYEAHHAILLQKAEQAHLTRLSYLADLEQQKRQAQLEELERQAKREREEKEARLAEMIQKEEQARAAKIWQIEEKARLSAQAYQQAKARITRETMAEMPMPRQKSGDLENDFKPPKHVTEQEHTYVSGDVFFLWGRNVPLRVVMNDTSAASDAAFLRDGVLVLYTKRGVGAFSRKKLIYTWYRATLIEQLRPLVSSYYKQAGLAEKVKIQLMNNATRWFTNNYTTGTIWVDEDMAKLDMKYLDYAVASELCILRMRQMQVPDQMLHAKYCTAMDVLLPQWRALREGLSQHICLREEVEIQSP